MKVINNAVAAALEYKTIQMPIKTHNVGSESGNTMNMSAGRLPKKGRERRKKELFPESLSWKKINID